MALNLVLSGYKSGGDGGKGKGDYIELPAAGSGDNPYHLPAGEQYYVVHAEMMLQHRWVHPS